MSYKSLVIITLAAMLVKETAEHRKTKIYCNAVIREHNNLVNDIKHLLSIMNIEGVELNKYDFEAFHTIKEKK